LRPRTIDRAVGDDAADAPGAELLRLRRKAEERIDLALDEELFGADRAAAPSAAGVRRRLAEVRWEQR
jgi:hypothetical protein